MTEEQCKKDGHKPVPTDGHPERCTCACGAVLYFREMKSIFAWLANAKEIHVVNLDGSVQAIKSSDQ